MTGDTTPISDEAITRLIKAFYEAHGVESWESSAEYRYGAEHHWMREALNEAAPLFLAEVVSLRGQLEAAAGDEHHTMDELYEYRMLYNAHAARGWHAAGLPVVKSWRHSDGELCFGGGWFIVSARLPTGQVTNHYASEHWDLFDLPEVELPPEYDGHTPADAAERLRSSLGGGS